LNVMENLVYKGQLKATRNYKRNSTAERTKREYKAIILLAWYLKIP
jgi:hypothetical protein